MKPELLRYQYSIKTIDSHTMGEPTRIIYDGFPDLPGSTMMEKKNYLVKHYDFLRKAVMLEPRGHRDMFGALLTKPANSEADFGVIFMDSGSYLNMCGHGSIGAASMIVETGMVKVTEPYTEVVLDAPSGIIRTRVHVVNGKAVEASILNVPSFLYRQNLEVNLPDYGCVTYDISFGGSFFALVDARKLGISLSIESIEKITDLGMKLLKIINKTVDIKHPYLDITTVDLVEFYSDSDNDEANLKNCVVFGASQVDRSPCGTGTSAKMAALYARGQLGLNQEFVYESITGTIFKGMLTKEVDCDGMKCVIPQITGSAYITGLNNWVVDEDDPLRYGFLLGEISERDDSLRSRIVRAAWELFHVNGFEKTTMEMIAKKADVLPERLYREFACKEDLEFTLGEFFDQKYEQLVMSMDSRISSYDELVYLNQELFGVIEEEVPFDLMKHIYVSIADKRHELLDQKRFYYKLIPQIIKEGYDLGEYTLSETPESIADNYASLERGLIYDWCIKDGSYSLRDKSRQILPMYLKQLLAS